MLESFLESIDTHSQLKNITVRSVFGGKGVLSEGVMFALVKDDQLYLRASNAAFKADFIQSGCVAYEFNWRSHSRNYPSLSNYYSVPSDISHSMQQITTLAEEVWSTSHKIKLEKDTPTRIKDLPNMQYKTERMLRKAGINSIEELRELGPVNAYRAICLNQDKNPGVNLLYHIAGAIDGIHWSIIPENIRTSLKREVGTEFLAQ
ncbi:TfoX/Sxy family DNA transformation protein [Vibrio hippocampi]|uniref:DNA transformation protein TfoX1 n=1 Tax=Vibrio hippocampi TaxID=654686 RepID=A0ABN8DMP6_9VIBR|nr:TfoX/Sxy family DNA transformation protein [Vibrio hippocampi]CAH0529704.1 DNA transformation protein TfoX1 [Vibrio hippocampi]